MILVRALTMYATDLIESNHPNRLLYLSNLLLIIWEARSAHFQAIICVDRGGGGGSPGQDPPNHATRGGPPMDGPTQLLDKKK
jgi:hypothetical protein